MAENRVQITIEAVNRASKELTALEKELKGMQEEGQKAGLALSQMSRHFLSFAAAAGGIAGVTSLFKSFVKEAGEAEQVESRLRFALEGLGYAWRDLKPHVDRYARSVQEMTRFSDEEARRALTDMLLYTRDFAKAQDASRLAMAFSVRTGHDLSSAARLVGMALSGNVEMLGRYLPELGDLEVRLGKNATASEKAAYALRVLNEKFGFKPQEDMSTYAGKLQALQNSWKDLGESLGNLLLPRLKETYDWLKKVVDRLNELVDPGQIPLSKKLSRDLEPIQRQIKFYEDFLARAETAKPGSLYRLSPEAMQEAREKLEKLRDSAKSLKEEIQAAAKEEIKPVKSLKDAFPQDAAKKYAEIVSQIEAAWAAVVQEANETGQVAMAQQELRELGWAREKDLIKQIQDAIAQMEREAEEAGQIAIAQQELKELGYTREKDLIEQIRDAIARMEREAEEAGQIAMAQQELREAGWAREAKEFERVWADVAQNLSSAMQAGFFDLFKKGVTDIKGAWRGFLDNLVNSWYRALAQMASNYIMFGNMTGYRGAGSTGGLIGLFISMFARGAAAYAGAGSGFDSWAAQSAAVYHEGSSRPPKYRWIPRLHSGLASDEFPAILQRGEIVLSRRDVARLRGGDTVQNLTISVPVNLDDRALASRLRSSLEATIRREVVQIIREQG